MRKIDLSRFFSLRNITMFGRPTEKTNISKNWDLTRVFVK